MTGLVRVHVVQFSRVFTLFVFYMRSSLEPVFTFLVVCLLREERRLHALRKLIRSIYFTYLIEKTVCFGEITYHDLYLS